MGVSSSSPVTRGDWSGLNWNVYLTVRLASARISGQKKSCVARNTDGRTHWRRQYLSVGGVQ